MIRRIPGQAVTIAGVITGFADERACEHNPRIMTLLGKAVAVADIAEFVEHLGADAVGADEGAGDLPAQFGHDAVTMVFAELVLQDDVMAELVILAERDLVDPADVDEIGIVAVAVNIGHAEAAIEAVARAFENLEAVIPLRTIHIQSAQTQIILHRRQAQRIPVSETMIE